MFYRAATTDQTPNNQALKGFYISEQMSSYISGNSVTGARMWHNYHSIFSPCPWIQRSRWHGWRLCKHPTTGAHIHYVHHLHTYLPPPQYPFCLPPLSVQIQNCHLSMFSALGINTSSHMVVLCFHITSSLRSCDASFLGLAVICVEFTLPCPSSLSQYYGLQIHRTYGLPIREAIGSRNLFCEESHS